MSSNISVDMGSSSDSFTESIASIYSLLSSGGINKLSSDFSPIRASSLVSDNKSLSSNFANKFNIKSVDLNYACILGLSKNLLCILKNI